MTPIPYLVTPPATLPVTLAQVKAHLRVVHNDDDADITSKIEGAVAVLDAHGGVLGRCIVSQVWAIDVEGAGPHLLPFPDASNIVAESDGDAVAYTTQRRGIGLCVTITDAQPDQAVTIRATYGLPSPRISAAQSLIKLMVQREFDAMAGPDYDAITRSIQAIITAMRWVRI
jgi:hypothetical protein